MKNYLSIPIITLLLFCLGNNAQAQTTIHTAVIDFKEKSMNSSVLEKLRRGDFYQIQIKGINMNLYKVTIDNMDSTIETALPFPIFSTLNTGTLSELIANLSKLGGTIASIPESAPKEQLELMQGLKSSVNKEAFTESIINQIEVSSPDKKVEFEMEVFQKLLNKDFNKINILKMDLTHFYTKVSNYILSYSVLDKNSTLSASLRTDISSLASILESLEKYRNDIIEINAEVLNHFLKYDDNTLNARALIKKRQTYIERDSLLRVAFVEFKNIIDSAFAKVDSRATNDIVKTIIALENNSTETYTSLPLQFSKDQTNLSITISPKETTSNLPEFSTKFVFPIRKKTFYGISSSFFISNMYDSAYSIQTKMGSDTTHNLIGENSGGYQFGFSTMFKFGSRIKETNSFIQFGVGPGISITDKIKPRLLAGLGYAYGDKHKLIVDIGANIGYVDRLSRVYEVGKDYKVQPANYMVSSITTSVYISLGYMFTF